VADQCCSIDPCDEIERVERLFCPAGEFVAVEQIRDRALDRRNANVEPHAVNHHHPVLQLSVSSGKAARRLDEAAREARRLQAHLEVTGSNPVGCAIVKNRMRGGKRRQNAALV